MRFRITLGNDLKGRSELPINYQYELSSWIYSVIGKSDTGFAGWVHNNGYTNNNKKFKLFTFSRLFPEKYIIDSERLRILSESFMFSFSRKAPPELVQKGYYGGFGEKNSLGFGCCDVLKT